MTTLPNCLEAEVTCGKYVKAVSGKLTLSHEKLRFETGNECVFDLPVNAIEKITWHWYSFSGAFEAVVGGKSYFLSFVPRNAGRRSWNSGMIVGRQFRAAMEGREVRAGSTWGVKSLNAFMFLGQVFMLLVALVFCLMEAFDDGKATLTHRIIWGFIPGVLVLVYLVGYIILTIQESRKKS
jgi:hypothetical protein